MTNIFEKVQTAKHLKEREDLINLKDDWLIDTLMPSSQAGILVAPFKSFKSSLAMHMALMVSQGLPFFGYDTKRSKTLYIDNEDTDRELNKRLRNKDNAPEDLHFLTGGEFMLDDSNHMNLLYEYIKENDIKFVILDNLMTMLRNGDIIYGKDFEPMLRRITRLKLLFQDVTFLLVAHANKSAYANSMDDKAYMVKPSDALGGSTLTAWAEFMLMLSPKRGKHNDFSKLSVKARGYQFDDDLNFSYVDSVFTCVNKSKKEPDSELIEEVKQETPIETTKESAQAFLDLAKGQGKVIEND